MEKAIIDNAILGTKLGMSQVFAEDGKIIPVTVIQAGPCPIVQKKSVDRDGYEALQIAYGDIKERNVVRPIKGHFKKAKTDVKRFLREIKVKDAANYEVGQVLKCDIFKVGDLVDVTSKTRGRGFTGTVQRWNTHKSAMSHGSGYHRGVGSMGANSDPSRVFKGKKLPGQYGQERVTIQNLAVVRVDADRDLLLIKGAVPGAKGSLVMVKSAVKK